MDPSSPVKDPETEEHSAKRVFGSSAGGDFSGIDDKKVEMSKLLDKIQKQLTERAMEIEVKEKSVIERVKKVEDREKEVELREKSIKEKEKEIEDKEKEVDLLSKLIDEKSCQLDRKVELFDVKQIVATERRKTEAEEIEKKSKFLELKEKEVEEKLKELYLKQKMELGEGSSKRTSSEAKNSLILSAKRHKHEEEDKEIVEPNEEEDVSTEPIESEFNNFKKTINSFEVGQLWALYDHGTDGMPRLYGRIKNIVKYRSCIQVKCVVNQEKSSSVPVACGRFQYGKTETKDHLAFSHEMQGVVAYAVMYPRKGEFWAMFRDWNDNNPPYKYDFVEILLDFDEELGIGGMYLEKVDGFVSVFKHAGGGGGEQELVSIMIPPDEMNRFSHKVPFVRLSGEEKQGVPVGSFELDPAAIPSSILLNGDDQEVKK